MSPLVHRSRILRGLPAAIVLAAATVLGACAATTNVQKIDRLDSVAANPRVLLMPPDVRYYLITAGGVAEPHAEWTQAAQMNFLAAMQKFATKTGTDLVVLDDDDLTPNERQYRTLHSAVGQTVLANHFGNLKLPSKNTQFDWSLGPQISSIADDKGADYALFVFYRDEQASGGRIALAVLAAAAGGYAQAGAEYGFASLVDLRTGDIVWFNVVNAGNGEMRDPEGASTAVRALFRDIPTGSAAERDSGSR